MKIIGIDKDVSSVDEGMGERYLILDDYPPPYWSDFFAGVHQRFFSMQKRRARHEGKYIIVNCLREELQQQINDLKVQCEQASRETAKYVEKIEAERIAQEAYRASQRKSADDDFDRLKFDD